MDAFERRLRSIYDAFDSRNPKAAVKLANAALQKHKDSQILRVLKGLALQRMDKTKEAFEVCDQVLSEAPTDEHVLNILAMVYKSKAHQAKLTSAYEAAIKARPNDVNLLVVLLSQYTRALDFVKQQQTAMKLHRLDRSSGDYLWWIVTSLVLQGRAAGASGQGSSNGEKLLQLAQSMAAKQLVGGSEQGDPVNALLMYHSILQERRQYKEALDAVKGPLGDAYNLEGERELVEAELTAELGDREAAASLYKQVALRNPQNWAAIQGYLECVIPCDSTATQAANGTADLSSLSIVANGSSTNELVNGPAPGSKAENFQVAETFVKELEAAVSSGAAAKHRGPLLAAVELEARRLSQAQRIFSGRAAGPTGQFPAAAPDTAQLASAIQCYFKHLGQLASCAADLRSYSSSVEGCSRERLRDAMHSHCQSQEPGDAAALKPADIQRRVSAFQVEHDLGLPEYHSSEVAEAHARELVHVYRQAAVLESGLDEKERGCADGLVALATGALIAAWKLEAAPRRPHRLLKAVLVLEAAQVARRVSAPLRLAAMGLYGLLGAPALAVENFTALDIKHIQHDTLSGHWLLPSLLGTLRADLAEQLLTACLCLYEDHSRDAGDTVLAAFQAASFTKVLEFVRFKERLAKSHARAVFYVESAMLSLNSASHVPTAAAAQVHEAAAGAVAQLQASLPAGMLQNGQAESALRFNEDLSTRPAWLPPDSGQPNLTLARWWSSQPEQQSTPGYGRCWWARTLAAEGAAPEAAAHRAAALASLQRRSLLPSLLLHATSSDHAAAATALKDIVEWLARLQGLPSLGDLPEGASAQQLSTVPLPELCQLLHLVTFAAASSVQASFSRPGEVAALQEAVERLDRMDSTAAALCDRLCDELTGAAESPLLAMGPAIFVAAAFANEEAYWIAICLQAWALPLKRRKKGKKAGAEANESASAAHEALQERLKTSGRALTKHLQILREAVAQQSAANEQAHVVDTLLSELSADEDAALQGGLWSWESRMAPRQVMQRVLQEQIALVDSVVMRLDCALAILSTCGQQ